MSSDNSTPPDGFRVIPGYPKYAISEHGVILSICVRGTRNTRPWTDAKHVNPETVTHGYHRVELWHDGKKRKIYVHTLVLTTFVGPCPDGMQCRHLDGNQENNHISNLAWGTRSENNQDKLRHGTDNRGEKHNCAKLNAANIFEIRRRAANGETQVDIAKDFSVYKGTICRIVLRQTWKHI